MKASLLEALRGVVGDDGLIAEPTRLVPYGSDGLAILRTRPDAVVLPRDTEQASACYRLLFEAGVPIVARGAGTGLSGGATPIEGGVVVGSARLRDVLEVHAVDRYARVQAGLARRLAERSSRETFRLF